jgi:hypothetical protein
MEATHQYVGQIESHAKAMGTANNIDFDLISTTSYMLNREPEYFVYIYNLSEVNIGNDVSFVVSRPPLIKEFKIRRRMSGQEYALVTRMPQPLLIPKGNVDSNEVDMIPQDVRRFAMDIINPDNLGIDQGAFIDPSKVTGQGMNLGNKGVFWSLNGPGATLDGTRKHLRIAGQNIPVFENPQTEEVKAARERMEKQYKKALEEADAVQISQPADLGKFLSPESHAACEYFGEDRSWHGKKSKTDFCAICGERMRHGAAFHKTEDGTLCVNNWDGAIRAGVKTRAQAFEATEDPKYSPKVVPVAPVKPSEEV